jgi:hypothetical protein
LKGYWHLSLVDLRETESEIACFDELYQAARDTVPPFVSLIN